MTERVFTQRITRGGQRFALAGAAAALALSGFLAASPAEAATQSPVQPSWTGPCNGSCWGKDPNTFGSCGKDAITTVGGIVDGVQMEVRYSRHCGAKWVRVESLPKGWDYYARDGWNNRLYWSARSYGSGSTKWTGMVDGSRDVAGCFLDGNCVD
ncbi:DUF2690 domain-containing protein [Actinocrispum wychmicini]|uniref:Uncharacterized protein DUF2690 n=1 Tax=Actinocrispum wychmicini TaxID=1213861 RepID=A0A4R2JFI2_9PSEU|nr:DUF2690 domain-containing protein [Actinocrispum wychmicini]TCO55666.1 uncharacterized protein DUF2690 [Actinocrispum wychmicini]